MVDIAVLGYGVVGSGVVEVVRKNSESIGKRAGKTIRVKKILDIRQFPESPDKELITGNAEDIFDDDSIKIVVETIGGARVAYEFTKRAFMKGKHVVTSNKELVALHGPELLKLARQNGVQYLFEASVGGGIPIIRPLNQCLSANEIIGIMGILNGTTNYILTRMKKDGCDFKDALGEAQQNGYAEADPTADIEGHDACRKIAILSSIAYNQFVDYRDISTEGIANVTSADMKYADELNSVIKLVAMSSREDGGIFARVCPMLLPKTHPLANVDDVFNAIVVKGDAIGEAMFYGRGAGKLPTASAVVADIIDIVIHIDSNSRNVWEVKNYKNVLETASAGSRFFTRLASEDLKSAKELVIEIFGKVEFISLVKSPEEKELAFITESIAESDFLNRIERLKYLNPTNRVENFIRVLGEA